MELSRKLSRYVGTDGDAAELQRVLDDLRGKDLLSDERFAGALVGSRAQRFGDARIRHDLHRTGVAAEVSAGALASLAGSEIRRAHDVWRKRFDALPTSAAERAKQARFLQSRGFSVDSVVSVLRGKVQDEST